MKEYKCNSDLPIKVWSMGEHDVEAIWDVKFEYVKLYDEKNPINK